MAQTAKHVVFSGRVQGVGFRYTTKRIADQHEIVGYVRNLSDGTVEMFAQGTAQDVDGCIQSIQDYFTGYIRELKIEQVPPNPKYTNFRITF